MCPFKWQLYLFLSLALIGCATFRTNLSGRVNSPELASDSGRVDVLFIFDHRRQSLGWDALPKEDRYRPGRYGFDEIFYDAYSEFSTIKRFTTFTNHADDVNKPERRALRDSLISTHDFVIQLDFRRTRSFPRQMFSIIGSSLSLTLLPVPYTEHFAVHATLMDSEKQVIRTYTRRAKLTRWVQTLLFMVYPFHPEQRKIEELYLESLHDIFGQMEQEHILSVTGSAQYNTGEE